MSCWEENRFLAHIWKFLKNMSGMLEWKNLLSKIKRSYVFMYEVRVNGISGKDGALAREVSLRLVRCLDGLEGEDTVIFLSGILTFLANVLQDLSEEEMRGFLDGTLEGWKKVRDRREN
ncbi:hypothetical protein HC928_02480 [bacterium]|nr:hypothetical protein [bacterium]